MKGFVKTYFTRNLFQYLGIGYVSSLLNILVSILLIRILPSYDLGRVSIGKSIFQSFEYSHFGLRFGLDRVLPHQKLIDEKNKYFTAVYLFSILTSFIFSFFWFLYDITDWLFYLMFSLSGLFYTLITVSKVYYRSFEDKSNFIGLSFWIQLFPIIIQLLCLYFWKINGFVVGHVASYAVVFFISYFFFKINLSKINKDVFSTIKELFSYGGVLFISSIINFLSLTGDRFLIAKFLGLEQVGNFSVIMFFFSALIMFSASYTELILNKIMLKPSFKYLQKQLLFIVLIAFFLVIISYPLLPYFVNIFIPKYNFLVTSIQLIAISSIPYACLPLVNNFLHAIDKRRMLLFINLISTIIYFIGILYILHFYGSFEKLVIWKFWSSIILVLMTISAFYYYCKILKLE